MSTSTVHLFVFDMMSDWEYGYLIAGVNNPQSGWYSGNPLLGPNALRELEASHRAMMTVHLDRELRSTKVLREMRR